MDQFECACGLPRCITIKAVNDGRADCNDASDELLSEANEFCPDATPSRKINQLKRADVNKCIKNNNPCNTHLNEVCVVRFFIVLKLIKTD